MPNESTGAGGACGNNMESGSSVNIVQQEFYTNSINGLLTFQRFLICVGLCNAVMAKTF